MPKIRPRWWPLLLVALLLLVVALMSKRPAQAQTEGGAQAAESAQADLQQAIDSRQQAQRQKDDWAQERGTLEARYRALKASVSYLEERRDAERSRLEAYESRVAELQRRIAASEALAASLEDTLREVLTRLDVAVAQDLPFLPDERSLRLQSVREDLVQPETPAAEKLRRVLEALQIETQFGGTVDVYRDEIAVGGDSLHADVLRLGRLALFWRTPDGRRVGHYDLAARDWVELPGKHHRAVERAMEMATRLRPVEVIGLPLGTVAP